MTHEHALLQRLRDGEWLSIKGLQPKKFTQSYAEFMDLCIDTDRGWVDIRSEEKKTADRKEELHSIRLHDNYEGTREWWAPRPGWNVLELKDAWRGNALDQLCHPPRHIRFYTRDRYRLSLEPPSAIFDECEAMEIISNAPYALSKLVIAVDSFIVAVVKVAIGEKERTDLLSGLREIPNIQ